MLSKFKSFNFIFALIIFIKTFTHSYQQISDKNKEFTCIGENCWLKQYYIDTIDYREKDKIYFSLAINLTIVKKLLQIYIQHVMEKVKMEDFILN